MIPLSDKVLDLNDHITSLPPSQLSCLNFYSNESIMIIKRDKLIETEGVLYINLLFSGRSPIQVSSSNLTISFMIPNFSK